MTHPAWQLKEAIYTQLTSSPQLMALVTGIFDYVPQATEYPYVFLAAITSADCSTLASAGFHHEIGIEVFCRERGSKGCFDIAEQIYEILHHGNVALVEDALLSIRFEKGKVEQLEDGLTYHAALTFSAITREA